MLLTVELKLPRAKMSASRFSHHACNGQQKLALLSSRRRVDSWNLINHQSGWVSIGKRRRVTNAEPLGEGQEPRATSAIKFTPMRYWALCVLTRLCLVCCTTLLTANPPQQVAARSTKMLFQNSSPPHSREKLQRKSARTKSSRPLTRMDGKNTSDSISQPPASNHTSRLSIILNLLERILMFCLKTSQWYFKEA